MLHNLLSNALRHTVTRGVTVRVTLEHQCGLLTVTDSGEGIAGKDLAHVFERFYRADKSRSRGDDASLGASIGLTVARHLTEALGGSLSLSSEPGQGTVARVLLPKLATVTIGDSSKLRWLEIMFLVLLLGICAEISVETS